MDLKQDLQRKQRDHVNELLELKFSKNQNAINFNIIDALVMCETRLMIMSREITKLENEVHEILLKIRGGNV